VSAADGTRTSRLATRAVFYSRVGRGATGILFAPVVHRLLHRFHVEDSAER
jgi:hypothetical protein